MVNSCILGSAVPVGIGSKKKQIYRGPISQLIGVYSHAYTLQPHFKLLNSYYIIWNPNFEWFCRHIIFCGMGRNSLFLPYDFFFAIHNQFCLCRLPGFWPSYTSRRLLYSDYHRHVAVLFTAARPVVFTTLYISIYCMYTYSRCIHMYLFIYGSMYLCIYVSMTDHEPNQPEFESSFLAKPSREKPAASACDCSCVDVQW